MLGYTDTTVDVGVRYYYSVAAINGNGAGTESTQKSAVAFGEPSAPTLTGAGAGNGEVVLTWVAPEDDGGDAITGYRVYRGTSPANLAFLAATGNVTTYTDSTAANGTTYSYAVTAVNAAGESELSDVQSATPAATAPSAPPLNGASAGNAEIDLSWATPSSNGGLPITGYRIYRGLTSSSLTLLTTVGVTTSYTDSGLANFTRYHYQVAALNAAGEGPRSNVRSAVPVPPGNTNNPSYWSSAGYGSCVKYEPVSTPYVLGAPPAGYYWSLLVLKAGSESSNDDWLTVLPYPLPGTYPHPSGKSISHVIVCKKPGSATTTTTSTPGSTTTTTTPVSTTIPGDDCNQYTPTYLAISTTSAEPGESVTITGSGFPGDTLVITISRPGYGPATIGTVIVPPGGSFSVTVIIPDDLGPGPATLAVTSDACACEPSSTTTTTSGGGGGGYGDDDDGYRYGNNDDDDGSSHSDDDDGWGDDDDGHSDDDDGHSDDDDGGGGDDPCDGTSLIMIMIEPLDLSGCGVNSYDRVFAPGETISWTLMGSSPFDTSKVPVTLKLVSRSPGGPTYTLYSGSYPPGLTVSVTIPAAAPNGQYYLNQNGKKSNNKPVTKSCPVRVGFDAVLARYESSAAPGRGRTAANLLAVSGAVVLLSTLRVRRFRTSSGRR